jgi:hypothetical protein
VVKGRAFVCLRKLRSAARREKPHRCDSERRAALAGAVAACRAAHTPSRRVRASTLEPAARATCIAAAARAPGAGGPVAVAVREAQERQRVGAQESEDGSAPRRRHALS